MTRDGSRCWRRCSPCGSLAARAGGTGGGRCFVWHSCRSIYSCQRDYTSRSLLGLAVGGGWSARVGGPWSSAHQRLKMPLDGAIRALAKHLIRGVRARGCAAGGPRAHCFVGRCEQPNAGACSELAWPAPKWRRRCAIWLKLTLRHRDRTPASSIRRAVEHRALIMTFGDLGMANDGDRGVPRSTGDGRCMHTGPARGIGISECTELHADCPCLGRLQFHTTSRSPTGTCVVPDHRRQRRGAVQRVR